MVDDSGGCHECSTADLAAPTVSVVLCTWNRLWHLKRAVDAVLAQEYPSLELVVVDDGSTDSTPEFLRGLCDSRVRVVTQANQGLGAARRAGSSAARGEWLVFLDDDDLPLPGWLAALTSKADDPACAAVCCAAEYISTDGRTLGVIRPLDLGPLFFNITGLFLAGTFAVRSCVFDDAGGYLRGMPCSHQTELGLRLVTVARSAGMGVATVDDPLIGIERRSPGARPLSSPAVLYWGARWLVARHAAAFSRDRKGVASQEGVAGVAAFRLGRRGAGRRHFLRSVRANPFSPRGWGRLALSTVDAFARRVWLRERWADSHPLEAVISGRGEASDFFLPWGYLINPQNSADSAGTPFWDGGLQANNVAFQTPVYRYAAKLIVSRRLGRVVDVGCGSGDKLVRIVGGATADFIGVDQPSGVHLAERRFPGRTWLAGDFDDDGLWADIRELGPSLVLCVDVVEHVTDPINLLLGIQSSLDGGAMALISTPDRRRLLDASPLGPPANPRHVREWTAEEFELLLEATGFDVVKVRHLLPRDYAWSVLEMKRMIWKLLHGRAIPDRRYNMCFLVRPRARAIAAADLAVSGP